MSYFTHISFHQIQEGDLIDFFELRHHEQAGSLLKLMHRNFQSAKSSNPRYRLILQDLICLLQQIDVQLSGLVKLESDSLFPFVRKLAEVQKHREPIRFLRVSLIGSSIEKIAEEHNHIIALLHSIKQLTNQFMPPADASEIMKLCYAELKEFDDTVMSQLDREQNILFPKILKLEDEVMHKSSIASTGTGGWGMQE
jgi:regulator of cell morphogenesis and NO signaling